MKLKTLKGCGKIFETINDDCTTETICVKGNLCDACSGDKNE